MKIGLPVVIAMGAVLAGCTNTSRKPPLEVFPDMDRQLRYNPQSGSKLFSDGRADRRPVPGTIARDELKADAGFYEGVKDEMYVGRNPLPLNAEVLARGQERFNIYCTPCHDRTGSGRGIVAMRAGWIASNLTEQRVVDMPDGMIFDTITHGRRTMPGYRYQVPEHDRWAIVAYVRALERAAAGTVEDVPQELRGELR